MNGQLITHLIDKVGTIILILLLFAAIGKR